MVIRKQPKYCPPESSARNLPETGANSEESTAPDKPAQAPSYSFPFIVEAEIKIARRRRLSNLFYNANSLPTGCKLSAKAYFPPLVILQEKKILTGISAVVPPEQDRVFQ